MIIFVPLYFSSRAWIRGVAFGGDEWTAPGTGFGTPQSAASLAALAATGASHVRLIITRYAIDDDVSPIAGASPLASTTPAQLATTLAEAHKLNMTVFLSPIVDPSWDVAENVRSADTSYGGFRAAGSKFASRTQLGASFSAAQWTRWFASYAAWITPLATLAQQYSCVEWFGLASGLDAAFLEAQNAPRWRDLAAAVRSAFPRGRLTISVASDLAPRITWWSALDAVGVETFVSLGANLSLGVAPSVESMESAWAPHVARLAALHAATTLPVLITSVGFQSRPSCHVRPNGTRPHNPGDDSPWVTSFDPSCQANAYEAFLRAFVGAPGNEAPAAGAWWAGVFWWLWRGDPTSGGTADSDFTPHAKPAEGVLRRYYGGEADASWGGGALRAALRRAHERAVSVRADSRAVRGASRAPDAAATPPRRRRWQGWVLGSQEWSSPMYRLDSEGAARALDDMINMTNARSVEVIAQWYVAALNSTEIYPITDDANPLRTATDGELRSIMQSAAERGLETVLTPMIDLDVTLPALTWCYATGCGWRGEIGRDWPPSECGAGSKWGEWWSGSYAPFIMHYARLANETNATAFLIQHELNTAAAVCPMRWSALVASVRKVYGGLVSAAFLADILTETVQTKVAPYVVGRLDFLGVDCYTGPGELPLIPYAKHGSASYPHPVLPWHDVASDVLRSAKRGTIAQYAQTAAWAKMKIVCTEVGFPARPWSYGGGYTQQRAVADDGHADLDAADCSVIDQCVAVDAQALAYAAFIDTFYAPNNTWFDGTLFWLWRADPTAGGLSDDGFVATGKPAAAVVAEAWRRVAAS